MTGFNKPCDLTVGHWWSLTGPKSLEIKGFPAWRIVWDHRDSFRSDMTDMTSSLLHFKVSPNFYDGPFTLVSLCLLSYIRKLKEKAG